MRLRVWLKRLGKGRGVIELLKCRCLSIEFLV